MDNIVNFIPYKDTFNGEGGNSATFVFTFLNSILLKGLGTSDKRGEIFVKAIIQGPLRPLF